MSDKEDRTTDLNERTPLFPPTVGLESQSDSEDDIPHLVVHNNDIEQKRKGTGKRFSAISNKVAENIKTLFKSRGKVAFSDEDDEEEEEQEVVEESWISDRKKQQLISRAKYYIPVLQWLPKYKWRQNLHHDIIAGLTVGVMLVPQALAYSNLAGLPSIYGLQTAFFPLIMYFLLGTSSQLSMGPEAVVTILIATELTNVISGNAEDGIIGDNPIDEQTNMMLRTQYACAITFLVGLFSFILGLFRFGFLARVLSRPLLCGFINAVALEVILEQSDKFFALDHFLADDHSYQKVPGIINHFNDWNYPTFAIGIGSLIVLLSLKLAKKLFPKAPGLKFVPDPFVVVLLGILFSSTLKLYNHGVYILGDSEGGFLRPHWPYITLDVISNTIPAAVIISIIGLVESLLISNIYSSKHNYRVSQNREMVAIGLSNIVSSFFGSIPAFGSLARSSVNDNAGAKTPVSGLVSSLVTMLSILFILPAFKYLPKVVMAAIIVNAALNLFEIHDILFLWKIRAWKDLILLTLTFLVTGIFGVEYGISVSVAASLILILKETTLPHVAILKRDPETEKFQEFTLIRDINLFEDKHYFFSHDYNTDKGILIIRIEEPLYFANIGQVKELFQKIEQRGNSPMHAIIFDAGNIPYIDASATQELLEMVHDWQHRNITVCFVKLRPQNQKIFFKSGLIDVVGPSYFFSKRSQAVDYVLGSKKEHSSYNM